MKYQGLLWVICIVWSCSAIHAQERPALHWLTPEGQAEMAAYLSAQKRQGQIPSPPPGKVRTMAEWEQSQALIITWAGQATILREIVRNAVKECKVFIVTTNPSTVESSLTGAGIALDSVRFINTPFNTIWVRDYGPWTVYKNDVDSLWIIDWIYNRPRQDDNQVPAAIATYLNLPFYEATTDPDDLVHTGGNHLPDGMGNVFSSTLIFEENADKTEAEIDTIMKKYLGVNQYIKLPTLPFDGIHHLDMHMRIIDEETILIGQYPEGISDGPQIEANIRYIQDSVKTSFGNQYRIIRLPMPPDQNDRYPQQGGNYRTYTNSIFINKTILVPTYEERYDTTALRIYRESLPGYNVVGINCNSIIGQLGALHCITKLVGAEEPLLIAHSRLRDVEDTITSYPVSAFIRHVSGIDNAALYFRASTEVDYTKMEMQLSDTVGNNWTATMPSFPAGTEVQYYIHATAINGKEQVRPMVAPEGYFSFKVTGEVLNIPPVVEITEPVNGSLIPFETEQLTIRLAANDIDGTIAHTSVFINGELFHQADSFTTSITWDIMASGDFAIVAEVTDDDGATATSDTTHITVEVATDVSFVDLKSEIQLYPNPIRHELFLDFPGHGVDAPEVQFFNALGQRIPIATTSTAHGMRFDFSDVARGFYVLRFINGGQDASFRLMAR